MDAREISNQLPNGFHGAQVVRIAVDCANRTADFLLRLLVPGVQNPSSASRLRGASFHVSGLAFLSADIPDPHYDYMSDSAPQIGSLLDTTVEICPRLPAFQNELGKAYFFHSFFVEEWNGFIHFAGTDASFAWTED
jgi:hypothetical protein